MQQNHSMLIKLHVYCPVSKERYCDDRHKYSHRFGTLKAKSIDRKITLIEVLGLKMNKKRGRGRPSQKLVDWMMEDGYGNARERPNIEKRWTFGPAWRQIT